MSTQTTPQVQKAVAELTEVHGHLVAEALRVEQALQALGALDGASVKPPRRPVSAPRKAKSAGSGRGGRQRSPQTVALESQVIEAVSLAPGLKVSEIAQRIGTDPQPLYTIVARLAKEGRVRKQSQFFYPVETG